MSRSSLVLLGVALVCLACADAAGSSDDDGGSGSSAAGSSVAGSGSSGSATAGSSAAASGTAGSGTAGSGTAGSATAGGASAGASASGAGGGSGAAGEAGAAGSTSGTAGSTSGTAGTAGNTSGAAGTATSGASGAGGQGAKVVLNEISGDEDWFELLNVGDATASLAGFGITDSISPATPDLAGAFRFPTGTMLAPGAYVVVWGGHTGADNLPKTDCPTGAPSSCFHAELKVSATDGEDVFVLAPGDAILDQVSFPKGTAKGESFGRSPDGTGAFTVLGGPTPGGKNP